MKLVWLVIPIILIGFMGISESFAESTSNEKQPSDTSIDDLDTKYLLSPKKQISIGVYPTDIICKDGLELIFKSSDDSPVCVKPETAMTLIERGWGEKNENKIWVVKLDTRFGDYWGPFDQNGFMRYTDEILYYYEKQNIKIHDVIIRIFDVFEQPGSCGHLAGCPQGIDYFLLVGESDVESMLNSGFSIVEINATKPIGFHSCDIDILNSSISTDNICSRDGRKILYLFQLMENLK